MKPAIEVWRFSDAPEEFKKLSENGGDEDWLALVPVEYADQYIHWLDSGSNFGPCNVDEYVLPSGSKVFIGAHA